MLSRQTNTRGIIRKRKREGKDIGIKGDYRVHSLVMLSMGIALLRIDSCQLVSAIYVLLKTEEKKRSYFVAILRKYF